MVDRGRWTLPGGGQNFGETLEETVIREVHEETGLQVSVGQLLSHSSRIWLTEEKEMHSFQFLFFATVLGGELTNEIEGSTDQVAWVELESIKDENSVDIVLRAKEVLMLLS